jgi:uncharacterized protein (TIGR03437 family)
MPVTVSGANQTANFAAAAAAQTWSISGTINQTSGGSVSGTTVTLSGAASATTTVNSSGSYSFTGLANGPYTVTPSNAGYSFTPAGTAVTISGANQTANFTAASAQTWTISGIVSPTAGGSGATVTLSGAASATTTANSSGSYSFTGLANGAYTVTPSNAGYSFTPASTAVTISGASQTANFAAASAKTWTISGTISPTAGGSGATVTLSGAASATTTANSSGSYSFTGLANGAYTVTPTNAGYSFTPVNMAVTVSGASQTANFTAAAAKIWTISGSISPAAGGSGATVTLSGTASAATTANSSGSYSFTGLPNGAYTVTPSNTGYNFTPVSTAVTIGGANQTANFTAASAQTTTTPTVDVQVSTNQSTASSTVVSPAFSTAAGNELLLALVSGGAGIQISNTTVKSVSGAGLTWVLVVRQNGQRGTAEIWRAFTSQALSNVAVTATLSGSVTSSMTVMSFTGVDTAGANGSGAIGAVGGGAAYSGAPTATLSTTGNNSLVIGVGTDSRNAIARTPGTGQSLVYQDLNQNRETYWVQTQASLTALSGTKVTISDSAPKTDPYDLAIAELLAVPALGGALKGPPILPAPLTLGIARPRQTALSLSNTASHVAGDVCTPGGLATLTGADFTVQGPEKATAYPLPTRLAGVRVKVNGLPAPLILASDSQVNFQCPQLARGAALTVALETENGVSISPIQTTMQPAAPGIFTLDATQDATLTSAPHADPHADPQGAILITGTNLIAMPTVKATPSRAVRQSESLTIYATGLDEVAGSVPPGTQAPLDRPIPATNKISVVIGGLEVKPTFVGLAPGAAGVFQVDAQLPSGVLAGPSVPLYIKVTLSDGTVVESNQATVAIDARKN